MKMEETNIEDEKTFISKVGEIKNRCILSKVIDVNCVTIAKIRNKET